jgi:YesN/AraC family two-component response regulator
MLCELLSLLGHTVTGAANAAVALDLLSSRKFDVLLTDINLPGQSGIHLAREAKAAAPEIAIIFASGHDKSMSTYIDFPSVWLTKPYEYEALLKALPNRSGFA